MALEQVVFQTLKPLCKSLGFYYQIMLVNIDNPAYTYWDASENLSSLYLNTDSSSSSPSPHPQRKKKSTMRKTKKLTQEFDDIAFEGVILPENQDDDDNDSESAGHIVSHESTSLMGRELEIATAPESTDAALNSPNATDEDSEVSLIYGKRAISPY